MASGVQAKGVVPSDFQKKNEGHNGEKTRKRAEEYFGVESGSTEKGTEELKKRKIDSTLKKNEFCLSFILSETGFYKTQVGVLKFTKSITITEEKEVRYYLDHKDPKQSSYNSKNESVGKIVIQSCSADKGNFFLTLGKIETQMPICNPAEMLKAWEAAGYYVATSIEYTEIVYKYTDLSYKLIFESSVVKGNAEISQAHLKNLKNEDGEETTKSSWELTISVVDSLVQRNCEDIDSKLRTFAEKELGIDDFTQAKFEIFDHDSDSEEEYDPVED